jgi:hypothetical protein
MGWVETGWAQLIYGPKLDEPKWDGPNRAVTDERSRKFTVNVGFQTNHISLFFADFFQRSLHELKS